MIVGISGKKQAGKDTVCNIIQYLMFKNRVLKQGAAIRDSGYTNSSPTFAFDIFSKWSPEEKKQYSGWERKLFADKLKDIVCLLINCTREQLEDNVFKETELGEEWWKYYVQLPTGMAYVSYNNTIDTSHFISFELIRMTPRLLLQLIGTECGRSIIHPNIWINALMSEYKSIQKIGGYSRVVKNNEGIPIDYEYEVEYPNWIITDVRFPNEVEAIYKRDGIVIRVENPRIGNTDTHASETSLDDYDNWNAIIVNDGSIEDLVNMVRESLQQVKLI